mmetsp:Transcript_121862/g.389715  ORF Transcript_121862/g.389715 Transcript_121862/m.389715 type:complete len:361 (+) Transcript_121862:537-1619(+)
MLWQLRGVHRLLVHRRTRGRHHRRQSNMVRNLIYQINLWRVRRGAAEQVDAFGEPPRSEGGHVSLGEDHIRRAAVGIQDHRGDSAVPRALQPHCRVRDASRQPADADLLGAAGVRGGPSQRSEVILRCVGPPQQRAQRRSAGPRRGLGVGVVLEAGRENVGEVLGAGRLTQMGSTDRLQVELDCVAVGRGRQRGLPGTVCREPGLLLGRLSGELSLQPLCLCSLVFLAAPAVLRSLQVVERLHKGLPPRRHRRWRTPDRRGALDSSVGSQWRPIRRGLVALDALLCCQHHLVEHGHRIRYGPQGRQGSEGDGIRQPHCLVLPLQLGVRQSDRRQNRHVHDTMRHESWPPRRGRQVAEAHG